LAYLSAAESTDESLLLPTAPAGETLELVDAIAETPDGADEREDEHGLSSERDVDERRPDARDHANGGSSSARPAVPVELVAVIEA